MNSITNHEVFRQLDRILASPNFVHSAVLVRFLKHIVQETIEGRGHELKEYTIGVAALKKDADFDPQIDSIVRIHAGRLRRALRDYYQSAGTHDAIAIVVPKGSYVPIFEVNAVGTFAEVVLAGSGQDIAPEIVDLEGVQRIGNFRTNRTDGKPCLWVAPFRLVSSENAEVHSSLTEYLSSELTKFDEIVIISSESEPLFSQQADFTVRGKIHLDQNNARVFVYLNGHDGRQYWAHTFDFANKDLWRMEDEVVDTTVAAIAGINGVISRVEMQFASRYLPNRPHWLLSYWYKQHVDHFDPQNTLEARRFYERVLSKDPKNALAASYLSEIICRQAFFEGDPEKISLLAQSLELARRALLMDPTCQQAYHAMALVSMVLGRMDESMLALEKGLAVNRRSVEFRASAGAIYIYMGKYDRGFSLLEQSLRRLPDATWVHLVSLALYAFQIKAYNDALKWLSQSKVDTFWVLLLRAAAAANADEIDIAKAAAAEFRRRYNLNPVEKSVVDDLFVLPEVAQNIHAALLKLSEAPLYVSERKTPRYSKKANRIA